MSTRKFTRFFERVGRRIWDWPRTTTKRFVLWLLRNLTIASSRPAQAGFVLPTVVMVTLVVVLLTTAILIRSFDRAKNATNFRINETSLYAAAPAIDRAKVKLDALFDDPTLPRATPSDTALYAAMRTSTRYTFGDETRLKVALDFNGTSGIQYSSTVTNDETSNTAWKFPIDTDNNGKFDTFVLYGIYFRNPPRDSSSPDRFARSRNGLEARTPPMNNPSLNPACLKGTGTSSGLVGASDWYSMDGKLKKSFYVYSVNVPISRADFNALPTSTSSNAPVAQSNAEIYKGQQGFSALEMQQDRALIPLTNNAVWFEDDFVIANADDINLNGRIHVNSNFLVTGDPGFTASGVTIPDSYANFYLISNKNSCYYQQENSKIIVAGNVANGGITDFGNASSNDYGLVRVHRFPGTGSDPTSPPSDTQSLINSTNKSTTKTGGSEVAYNTNAYDQRIGLLVDAAYNLTGYTYSSDPNTGLNADSDPVTKVAGISRYQNAHLNYIVSTFTERYNDSNRTQEASDILYNVLSTYFRDRTRRVPFAEVAGGASATGSFVSTPTTDTNFVFNGQTGTFRPPDTWMRIDAVSPATTNATGLSLKFSSTSPKTMDLAATNPNGSNSPRKTGVETRIGDRIQVGNNLPKYWWDTSSSSFQAEGTIQNVLDGTTPAYWNDDTTVQRTRTSQIESLPDLGGTTRDAFWERAAAKIPPLANMSADDYGGLRVITGAGVYDKTNTFLPAPTASDWEGGTTYPLLPKMAGDTSTTQLNASNIATYMVWPDTMPMYSPSDSSKLPHLKMRATAVYHTQGLTTGSLNYAPIACVSSYLDPTNATTAQNNKDTVDYDGGYGKDTAANGARSNNGVVYSYTRPSLNAALVTKLKTQAQWVFPNGRFVNQPLQKALAKLSASGTVNTGETLSLSDWGALDSTICALAIYEGTTSTASANASPPFAHGAIKEAAFLDARQVKSVNSLRSGSAWDNTRSAIAPADLTASNTAATNKYSLPLEQRQPLEIRVTDINLGLIRDKEIGTPGSGFNNADSKNAQEYILPNSGLIYATRDDALPDLSAAADRNNPTARESLTSTSDFILDPTRRPNGIRLINGSRLDRGKDYYRIVEKGLILATNLPVYVQADSTNKAFNLHAKPGTTNLLEEFTNKLASDWSNFYTGASGTTRNTLENNFACRKNQAGCGTDGDQWRPATIIGDSITLLSPSGSGMTGWKDGFREDGDYNLNNNRGNSVVTARLKAGFWNNNFVVNKLWTSTAASASAAYYPTTASSYATNGVTPVQRRVNGVPEYLMEYCPDVILSNCTNDKWIVKTDGTKASNAIGSAYTLANFPAGTTAEEPTDATIKMYPRRIAVKRNGRRLFLEEVGTTGNATPRLLGINSSGNIAEYSYKTNDGSSLPRTANRALWYQTTSSTTGQPSTNIGYRKNRLLAYDITSVTVGAETPDIPGVFELNQPSSNPASGYTICTDDNSNGSSKKFSISSLSGIESGKCSTQTGDPMSVIQTAVANLTDTTKLNPGVPNSNVVRPQMNGGTYADLPATAGSTTTYTDTAGGKTNLIEITDDFNTASTCTKIVLNGTADSIFVLRKTTNSDIEFGKNATTGHCGVQVELGPDVDPNNIIWATKANFKFNAVDPTKPHTMAGSFLSKGTGAPKLETVTWGTYGGRYLGANGMPSSSNFGPSTSIRAIAADGQPRPFPMLQIHTSSGVPRNNDDLATDVFAGLQEGRWLTLANSSSTSPATFNLAMVVGDTPSRSSVNSGTVPNETGGGFINFPRTIENWGSAGDTDAAVGVKQPLKISGSFIESRLSSYSTAPYQPSGSSMITDSSGSLFYTANQGSGGNQTVYSLNNTNFGTDTGFKYAGGANARQAPFMRPPTALWGYDVALLTQSPDLFAGRFTVPPAGKPDEYFREVDRSDTWIQTLLCAGEASDRLGAAGTSTTYSNFAVRDPAQRGTACQGSSTTGYPTN